MLLEIKNLNKSFHGRPVLKNLSLSVSENQITGLLGPNGTGKSTLMKCIAGMLNPDSGEITVSQTDDPVSILSQIAYLPDKICLNPNWTVKKAIQFFSDFYQDFDPDRARDMIRGFDLDEKAEIKSMSKGMQEKLQIALIMARKAKLYILDEPLSGIDPAARDRILNTILTNFEDGASMLISTHLISDVERILDRALFMDQGDIVVDGQADDLREARHQSLDEMFREMYS